MKENFLLKVLLVFIVSFFIFFISHLFINGFVSSDDPYYHAKHALLIEQSGNLSLVEPWLEFHFLNYAPVDPWWGYHLGLALFIYLFGSPLGIKFFVSLLAALVFSVFYLILNDLRVKYSLVWVSLLFYSSSIFGYRLFLERPHLLSMIFLPLALWFLIREKYFWLFFLSLVYVLFYNLAPLVILPALVFMAVGVFFNKQLNLKPLIATIGGILAGVIIHPASLNYLHIIFIHLWQVLYLKFSGINLNVGGEIQSMDFFEFLNSNVLALLAFILATALFLSFSKLGKSSVRGSFLFIYSGLWFLVTLLIPRGVEYWLPANFLFIAVVFTDFSGAEEFKIIKNFLAGKINFKIAGFFLLSALIAVISFNLSNIFGDLYYNKTNEIGANYEQANLWLKANSEAGSVVFYDSWSMWPMMFFYNDYNHYITGMDPTFLYEYDAPTYWLWRNISSQGLYCAKPEPCLELSPHEQIAWVPLAIKTVFRSKYAVVVDYEESRLIKVFNNLKDKVRLVFKNKNLLIYEMR